MRGFQISISRSKNDASLDPLIQWGALVAWIALTLVVCIRAAHNPASRSVYPVYTRAAHHWLQGQDLYAGGVDFRYSPPVAAAFVPLAVLPDSLGAVLWRLFSIGIFLFALAWWILAVLPDDVDARGVATLFLLTIPIAAASINNGQVNALLVALLMMAVSAAAIEAWTWACVFVVLAAALKVYPAALGLLLLLMFPRRIAIRLLLVSIIAIALSFVLRNPDYVFARYQEWIEALRTDHRQFATLAKAPTDFRLILRRLHCQPPEWLYALLQAASAALVALLTLIMSRRLPKRETLLNVFGLACCWMLLFGPATEGSTFTLLAPMAAWMVIAPVYTTTSPTVWALGLAGYLFLLASQIVGWFSFGSRVQSWGIAPGGALLIMVALIIVALRPPAAAPQRI